MITANFTPTKLSKGLGYSIALLSLASTTQAALLSAETFSNYTIGGRLSQTATPAVAGYTGNWTDFNAFGTAYPEVTAGSLVYSSALHNVGTGGGKISVPSNNTGGVVDPLNSSRVYRLLDSSTTVTATTTGTRYLSFLFQGGGQFPVTAYQMLELYNGIPDANNNGIPDSDSATRSFNLGLAGAVGPSTTNFIFGSSETYSNTGVAANTVVNLFVVKFDLSAAANSDTVTVWVNPTLGAGEPSIGRTVVTGRNVAFDRLAIADYDGSSASWDEIRFGTSFDGVTAIPEPSTFSAFAGLAVLGAVGLRRRNRKVA